MNPPTARYASDPAHTKIRRLPASSGQERLWLSAEADGSTAPYAVPVGYQVATRLTADRLAEALRYLMARHDGLRTGLRWTDDGLSQEVHPVVSGEVRELSCAGPEEFAAALGSAAAEPFDLARPPLVRALLAPLGADRTAFGFVFHHSVCDSWALEIFLKELTGFLDGRPPEEPAGDHAAWSVHERYRIAGPEAEPDRAYWRERLRGGAAPLRLSPEERNGRGGAVHRFSVPARAVERLVGQTAATPFSILLAGFGVLLHRYSLNERIGIGLPIAGRGTPEAERVFGYLSNTVVALEEYPPGTTFRTAVASAFHHVLEGLEHGGLPFQDVVGLPGVRQDGGTPLYQVMFGPQNTPVESAPVLGGLPLTRLTVHNGTSKCDLTLLVDQVADRFDCELEYDTALFGPAWADRWATAYGLLLESAAEAPDVPVDELTLLTPEQAAAAAAPRPDAVDYRGEPPVHLAFEAQARRSPDAVAVRWDDGTLTYRQLNERANAFAARLADLGLGPGSRLGIRLGRGPELLSSVLGIFKAGAAFVPLDPRFPIARIRTICADADVRGIVADASDAAQLSAVAPVLVPDEATSQIAPGFRPGPDDLAYIYYTSGSTGTPKGVPIDHRCVAVRLGYLRDAYPLGPGDAVLHKTPLIFDISIWEIFLPLFAGGQVRVVGPGRETDNDHLHALLQDEPVALVHFVPAALEAYLSATTAGSCPRLRWVIASGEAVTTSLLRRARDHFGVPAHVQYGQTETSEVTVWDGTGEHAFGTTLLGREVGSYSLHVVDRALRPVPLDLPGELCVSAPGGLAWGYQGRPGLTAERFLPHPGSPGERLYRTGDVVRRLDSGLFEYLGRTDHQVKIHGCRVEPGEIENVLLEHPAVASCVVTASRAADGTARLTAYVVPRGETSPPELADQVRARLPWYMVPGAFVLLPELPRTMSGKIARDLLPEPDRAAFALEPDTEPPSGPVETRVAEVWSRVLGIDAIGRHDDFFRIGGTSLSALRVLGEVGKRFGITLRVSLFSARATVAALADAVQDGIEELVAGLTDEKALAMLEALKTRD